MAGIPNCLSKMAATKSGYQAKASLSQMQLLAKCWCKPEIDFRQKGRPANRGCQPKAAASKMPEQAKNFNKPQIAASQTWLPAKSGCKNTGNGKILHTKFNIFCNFGGF